MRDEMVHHQQRLTCGLQENSSRVSGQPANARTGNTPNPHTHEDEDLPLPPRERHAIAKIWEDEASTGKAEKTPTELPPGKPQGELPNGVLPVMHKPEAKAR